MSFRSARHAFAKEPRADAPPPRGAADLALVVVAGALSVAEALLRDDVRWPLAAIAVGLCTAAALLVRRAHPLPAFIAAFGLATLVDVAAHFAHVPFEGLYSHAFALVLVHAVFRYGSGREVLVSGALMSVLFVATLFGDDVQSLGEAVGAGVVFALPAAIGVTARERARAHTKELQNVRLGERAALARELHDTVAHHVAAIAIQAQAGRAVLALEPARAGLALTRIEDEAKDTLRELREIVGALRDVDVDDTGDARVFDIAPTSIVAALEALAQGSAVQVALAVEGDTDALSPALGRALHRIARESLTNVVRHARHARAIGLTLDARDPTRVVLTVDDDGEHATERAPGFGITGMRERATLLGGTLTAGPRDDARGWRVRATLPQSARERVGGSS